MKKYETTIVLDAGVDPAAIDNEIGSIGNTITANGGKILTVERWGVRRFAYELKKRHQGNYIHIKFEGPGGIPDQLNQQYRINEKILRFMTVVSVEVDGMAGALEKIRAEEGIDKSRELIAVNPEETPAVGDLDLGDAPELTESTSLSEKDYENFGSEPEETASGEADDDQESSESKIE